VASSTRNQCHSGSLDEFKLNPGPNGSCRSDCGPIVGTAAAACEGKTAHSFGRIESFCAVQTAKSSGKALSLSQLGCPLLDTSGFALETPEISGLMGGCNTVQTHCLANKCDRQGKHCYDGIFSSYDKAAELRIYGHGGAMNYFRKVDGYHHNVLKLGGSDVKCEEWDGIHCTARSVFPGAVPSLAQLAQQCAMACPFADMISSEEKRKDGGGSFLFDNNCNCNGTFMTEVLSPGREEPGLCFRPDHYCMDALKGVVQGQCITETGGSARFQCTTMCKSMMRDAALMCPILRSFFDGRNSFCERNHIDGECWAAILGSEQAGCHTKGKNEQIVKGKDRCFARSCDSLVQNVVHKCPPHIGYQWSNLTCACMAGDSGCAYYYNQYESPGCRGEPRGSQAMLMDFTCVRDDADPRRVSYYKMRCDADNNLIGHHSCADPECKTCSGDLNAAPVPLDGSCIEAWNLRFNGVCLESVKLNIGQVCAESNAFVPEGTAYLRCSKNGDDDGSTNQQETQVFAARDLASVRQCQNEGGSVINVTCKDANAWLPTLAGKESWGQIGVTECQNLSVATGSLMAATLAACCYPLNDGQPDPGHCSFEVPTSVPTLSPTPSPTRPPTIFVPPPLPEIPEIAATAAPTPAPVVIEIPEIVATCTTTCDLSNTAGICAGYKLILAQGGACSGNCSIVERNTLQQYCLQEGCSEESQCGIDTKETPMIEVPQQAVTANIDLQGVTPEQVQDPGVKQSIETGIANSIRVEPEQVTLTKVGGTPVTRRLSRRGLALKLARVEFRINLDLPSEPVVGTAAPQEKLSVQAAITRVQSQSTDMGIFIQAAAAKQGKNLTSLVVDVSAMTVAQSAVKQMVGVKILTSAPTQSPSSSPTQSAIQVPTSGGPTDTAHRTIQPSSASVEMGPTIGPTGAVGNSTGNFTWNLGRNATANSTRNAGRNATGNSTLNSDGNSTRGVTGVTSFMKLAAKIGSYCSFKDKCTETTKPYVYNTFCHASKARCETECATAEDPMWCDSDTDVVESSNPVDDAIGAIKSTASLLDRESFVFYWAVFTIVLYYIII